MKIEEHMWSRQQLVLTLANRDGGAHVHPSLDEDYYRLSRQNLLGWLMAVVYTIYRLQENLR